MTNYTLECLECFTIAWTEGGELLENKAREHSGHLIKIEKKGQ